MEKVLPSKRALNPPLGLATLAALCPADWEVSIVDENVETIPLEPSVDIVGICGMTVQFDRQRELMAYYRRRGLFVVVGGSYASLCPERYRELADAVISGEAENIWPAFCQDFINGVPQPLYKESGVVDLASSPPPRFDLLKLDKYTTVSLQFSRGCPYLCEFCDIIVMFGRKPRTKTPEQIGLELDVLRSLGVRNLFFVDDNLIGHRPKAKALLRFLAEYQQKHQYAFQFGTEASLNLAGDDELLNQMSAANFAWVFVGIESPDVESLRAIGKVQNTRQDILGSVRRIYRHGIDVLGGFIVGFDNDNLETFDRQERFILDAGIQVSMVGLLTALPRTPLFERMEREGRLISRDEHGDNTGLRTNIVPKHMRYEDMVDAYAALYRRLFSDKHIAARILNKSRYLRKPVYRGGYALYDSVTILLRLLVHGVLPGGPRRWLQVLRTFFSTAPVTWPQVTSDWIAGLSMRNFVNRRFRVSPKGEINQIQTAVARLVAGCGQPMRRGTLQIGTTVNGASTQLALSLRGFVEPRILARTGRRLEQLLRETTVSLTLHIEHLADGQRRHLEALLKRLACHGDRVSIRIRTSLQTIPSLDSSVFHLVLDDA